MKIIGFIGICMIILINGCQTNNQNSNIIGDNGMKFDVSNNLTCLYEDNEGNIVFLANRVCGGQFGFIGFAKCGFECNPHLNPERINTIFNYTEELKPNELFNMYVS